MMSRSILLIICLICVGEIALHNKVNAVSKEQCVAKVKKLDRVELSSYLADFSSLLREGDVGMVNRCLRSIDGHSDLKLVQDVVEQASASSVCKPEFVDQLLTVNKQLKANASRGKVLKRKQTNRLLPFFRMFAGQVVLTCKKSLAEKLESAEKDEVLVASLAKITEVSEARNVPIDDREVQKLSAPMRKIFNLAIKYTPTVFSKVENIILADSLKPTPDSELSIQMTFNSQQSIEEFYSIKKACKKIEQYAQGSIYAIPRLAVEGYLARDDTSDLERNLSENSRLLKWIQVVQHCQGVLLVVANLDLESDVVDRLDKEILNDERIFIVNIDKKPTGVIVSNPTHTFDQSDTFDSFDKNLKCYTQSKGFSGWLMKHVGAERLLSKYLKLSVLDESIKQSLMAREEDPEHEVQFGSTAPIAYGMGYAHGTTMANMQAHVAHHASSHAHVVHQWGIAIGFILGCILAVTLFCMWAAKYGGVGRDHPDYGKPNKGWIEYRT